MHKDKLMDARVARAVARMSPLIVHNQFAVRQSPLNAAVGIFGILTQQTIAIWLLLLLLLLAN